MQIGIGYNHNEITELIRRDAAKETGENPENLDIHFSCWQGQVSVCVTHTDGVSPLLLPKTKRRAS